MSTKGTHTDLLVSNIFVCLHGPEVPSTHTSSLHSYGLKGVGAMVGARVESGTAAVVLRTDPSHGTNPGTQVARDSVSLAHAPVSKWQQLPDVPYSHSLHAPS
jgi:hypothetical protein